MGQDFGECKSCSGVENLGSKNEPIGFKLYSQYNFNKNSSPNERFELFQELDVTKTDAFSICKNRFVQSLKSEHDKPKNLDILLCLS